MTSITTSIITFAALCITSNIILAAATTEPGDDIVRTTVWKRGDGAYQVYRIPSIVLTKAGTLLAFCEGRQTAKGSDSGEINLIVKRSSDGGKTFGDQSVVWADGKNTCGNPCPVIDQSTGVIWMVMTRNAGADSEHDIIAGKSKERRTIWVTSSGDDGKSWSTPREITSEVSNPDWRWYATGPGIGIQLERGTHNGRLVIPCDHVKLGGGHDAGNSHVIYSDDHGATWKIGGEAPEPKFNESQIAELSDGRLMLNMRNVRGAQKPGSSLRSDTGVLDDAHTRGVCISEDGGETFKDLWHDPVLIEPICQGSILFTGGSLYFSNPASESKRMAMTVRKSDDDGKTWKASKLIFAGPSAYSCLVALPDGSIGVLYERGEKNSYEQIEFARFKFKGKD